MRGCVLIPQAKRQYEAELMQSFELPETLEMTAKMRRQHPIRQPPLLLSNVFTTPILERAEDYWPKATKVLERPLILRGGRVKGGDSERECVIINNQLIILYEHDKG
jgi:hypothetical protein